jgi:tetratricopeptide (TPR) repeat protein
MNDKETGNVAGSEAEKPEVASSDTVAQSENVSDSQPKEQAEVKIAAKGDVGNKPRPRKKLLVIGSIVLLVILLALGVAYLYMQNASKSKEYAYQNKKKADQYAAIQKKAESLDDKGQYGVKAQVLEEYLATGNPTPEQRAAQTQQLAATYMQTEDYQKALEAFKKTESEPNYKAAALQGESDCYVKLGDIDKAIEADKAALEAYKKLTGKTKSAKIQSLEDEIKRLEESK